MTSDWCTPAGHDVTGWPRTFGPEPSEDPDMKQLRWTTAIAGFALAVAACNESTAPNLDESIDLVDPVVVTFAATQGLPGGPIGEKGGAPFMGGMAFGGAPRTPADGRGPGAAFPDSIKLTAEQKTQIQALVAAFAAANAADIAAMHAAHRAARDAHRAGKSREEIKAILDAAKPAADRVRTNADALRAAIGNVLTPLQRAWLDAHKPSHPPRTP
jgi:Spy/CpxP family protein refolding chaperone